MENIDFFRLCACFWFAFYAYWFTAAWFVKTTQSSEGMLERMQHLIPLVAGFYLVFHGSSDSVFYGRLYANKIVELLGTVLTIMGLLFAVWARLHLGGNWSAKITLKEGHELIRSGPYRHVRHPIYTGFVSAVLGTALTAGTGDAFVGFVVILVSCLFKLRREETLMTEEFGDQYRQYQAEVPALVPFVY